MKYPFFGWRCARNRDYLLPTFRTLQSPIKTNSIYIVDIIPIGRETDALGEIQHHQAFDSFWGRSIPYVESIHWWNPASEKNEIMKTIKRQSIKWWKPASHPVVPTHHHYLNQTSDATWQGKPYGPPPLSTKGDHHKNSRKGDFQNRQKIVRPQFLRKKNYAKNAHFATFAHLQQECVYGFNWD